MIEKYNELVTEIVKEFSTRYNKEIYNEELQEEDYRMMKYEWIISWPLEINDEIYSIDDILLTIYHNISLKLVQKWNWQKLENTTNLNLYHFWKRNKNQEEYYQNEYKELVKSEKRREEAKKQLIEILNNK